MRSPSVLLPLCFLFACDPAPSSVCEVPEFRANTPSNGINLNGINLNSIPINGAKFQAIKFQGIDWQGIDLQGVFLQGAELRGGRLVAFDSDGLPVGGEALVGARVPARFDNGEVIKFEIAAVDGVFVELQFEGENICADGDRGLFVRGIWDETGARRESVDGAPEFDATYSCEAGVIAKCVMWGYSPSDVGTDVHQTCTRMARADYCGDGISYTKNGTAIDVADVLGVQVSTEDPEFEFEAGWGPDGAVCVSKPRYHETVVGEGEQLPSCWIEKPRCDDADEATTFGATLTNRSHPQERLLCNPR